MATLNFDELPGNTPFYDDVTGKILTSIIDAGTGISIRTVSANTTLLITDSVVRITGGTIYTLPTAIGNTNLKIIIKNVMRDTSIQINTTLSQTIYLSTTDTDTSFILYGGEELTVISDGTNWMITG